MFTWPGTRCACVGGGMCDMHLPTAPPARPCASTIPRPNSAPLRPNSAPTFLTCIARCRCHVQVHIHLLAGAGRGHGPWQACAGHCMVHMQGPCAARGRARGRHSDGARRRWERARRSRPQPRVSCRRRRRRHLPLVVIQPTVSDGRCRKRQRAACDRLAGWQRDGLVREGPHGANGRRPAWRSSRLLRQVLA